MHQGDINTGHYYSVVFDEIKQDWFCFNDEKVTKVGINDVISKKVRSYAYILSKMLKLYLIFKFFF